MSCNCGQFQACMRDTGICVPSPCSGGLLDSSCQAFDGSKYCASGGCRPRLGNGSRCQPGPNPVENVCANGLECYRASRMDITGVCQPPGGGDGGGSRPTNPDPPRHVDPPARPADPPTTPVNPPQPPPSDNNGGGNNSGGGGGSQPLPSNNNGGGSNSGGGGGGANPPSSGGGGNGGNNNGNPGSPSNGSSGTGNGGSTGSGISNGNSGSPATNNSTGGNSSNGGNNQFPGSNGSSPTAGNNSNSPANPTLPGLAPGSTSSASNSSTIGGVSLPVLVGSVIGAAALGVLIAMLMRRRRKPAQFPPHYPPNYFTQQQDPNDSSPPTLSRVVSPAFKPELQLAATGPEPKPYTRHEPAVDHLVLSTIPRASTHLTPGETAVNLDTEDVQVAPWTGQAVVSTIPRVVEVQLGPGDAELVLPTEFADGTRGMGERDTDTKVHCPTSPTL